MKEVLDKISSYNLFNYLFPGVLFTVILEKITGYSFLQENLIVNAFIAYFIGLVISRFGSLIVEPLLKKISFLHFIEYSSYVVASKKDSKIETLSEANNMYRTLNATFILIILFKLWQQIESICPVIKTVSPYLLISLLLTMFLYSYKKQTNYVVKRVKSNIKYGR